MSVQTGSGFIRLWGIAIVALTLLWAAPALAETPVERHGRLSVQGNAIIDEHGDPVVLRGMSLFWSQWQPDFYNAEAVQWLVDDWNVNVVRAAVAVHRGGYLEHPAQEMAKVETVIAAAVASGIYVIIDWHAHDPEPEAAAAFFEIIAGRHGHLPNLIYETWNEPLREHGWAEMVRPYHMTVVPRIRAIDPDNLIVAGTPTWSQDVDVAARDPLPFTNLAYTLHFYAGTHKADLRAKAQAALDEGVALFVTEWGTTNADGDGPVAEAETRAWFDFMETNRISYLNWSVAALPEGSAALAPGASGKGGWPDETISPSGRLVRDQLRARNP